MPTMANAQKPSVTSAPINEVANLTTSLQKAGDLEKKTPFSKYAAAY